MRVAIITGNQLPEAGGQYTFETEVFQSLIRFGAECGHSFVVFSWNREARVPGLPSAEHVQFISLWRSFDERLRSKLCRTATGVLKKVRQPRSKPTVEGWYETFVINSLVRNRIDLVWSTGQHCLTMEVPYVITVWDLQHRLQPYFPEVSVEGRWENNERFFRAALRRASVIVCGTEAGKGEIERFYQVPAERIKILPLPAPQWALEAPASHGDRICGKHRIPEEYLFYPAQFWPHKNHFNLLLAVRHLRDRHGLVLPVVLVGADMGNQAYIKRTVSDLDLTGQVHFLGFVPREDLICLYRNACALVYPSFFGPDNLPPLEAFALGCPVIASDVSGAREQLGDGALFVDPKRPEHIAEAIKLVHGDRTFRENLVQRGLGRASKWTGQDYVKGIVSVLDAFEAIRRTWSNAQAYHNIS